MVENLTWIDILEDNMEKIIAEGYGAYKDALENENIRVTVEVNWDGEISSHEYAAGTNNISSEVRNGTAIIVFEFCFQYWNNTEEEIENILYDYSGIQEMLEDDFRSVLENLEWENSMESY